VRGAVSSIRKSAFLTRLYGATALACVMACVVAPTPAFAQLDGQIPAPSVPAGSQMLLEADTLVYDNDNNTVSAVGGVQIDYGGNRIVAQRVKYDRNTSRLIASGNVEIIDSDGTKIYSEEIDITDDFANGFVNALRIETVDKTYFAAESAERKDGQLTTFNNGVYTACEPCEEKPDKAPIWRIKAQKIIWNGQAKTVRFEKSRFEFFGFPIAYLPAFEIADPTVKRKSGFLIPSFGQNSELGYGLSVPYYFALSPTYDLTVTGSGYTKQGFLGQAEWNQRFNNGSYTFTVAGIRQNDPMAFDANTVDRGTTDDPNRFRGMVGSKGEFNLNKRWAFGWDVMAQTDKNFSRKYQIEEYNQYIYRSEVYLTGLNDRNYFDLRTMKFDVQEEILDTSASARDKKQPWVLPSFDYSYTPDESIAGGELNIDINARSLYRSQLDEVLRSGNTQRVIGIDGSSSRLTGEAEWKRSFITDGGLVFTPLLAFQADTVYSNPNSESIAAIDAMAGNRGVSSDVRSAYNRFMATAGMELRWPVLFSATSSSHVLEPMGQIFARPDTSYTSQLGIPNEDAQSFVFDASTLFERDKFSGYDRIEGGTRANIGVRYSGSYDNGWSTSALAGQSYRVAGDNTFLAPDLVNVGLNSGLETDKSDYVGMAGFVSPFGLSGSASARLDEETFEVRRAELRAAYSSTPITVTARYAFIQKQEDYGFPNDRREVTLGASARVQENWRVFGSGTYDFESSTVTRNAYGFAYDDECFSYTMTMSEKRNPIAPNDDTERSFGFNISFRTLGDFGSSSSAFTTQ
jgi:LPS-assembly protein